MVRRTSCECSEQKKPSFWRPRVSNLRVNLSCFFFLFVCFFFFLHHGDRKLGQGSKARFGAFWAQILSKVHQYDESLFQLNPMHIPNSTFTALPHAHPPNLSKDGKLSRNINVMFGKPENKDATINMEQPSNDVNTTKI